jgi:hypothetical protein
MMETTMTTAKKPKPFSYDRSREAAFTATSQPCACCGRKVVTAEARHHVHVINGGAAYGGPEDTDDAGDMGWFPVGATCAKRLRKAGVHVEELANA